MDWRKKLAADPEMVLNILKREFLLSTEQSKLRPIFEETLRYLCHERDLAAWLAWEVPRFPIKGTEVTERWGVRGKGLRILLQGLRTAWVDSNCTTSSEELLSQEVYEKVSSTPPEEFLKEPILPPKRRRY